MKRPAGPTAQVVTGTTPGPCRSGAGRGAVGVAFWASFLPPRPPQAVSVKAESQDDGTATLRRMGLLVTKGAGLGAHLEAGEAGAGHGGELAEVAAICGTGRGAGNRPRPSACLQQGGAAAGRLPRGPGDQVIRRGTCRRTSAGRRPNAGGRLPARRRIPPRLSAAWPWARLGRPWRRRAGTGFAARPAGRARPVTPAATATASGPKR